MKYKKVGISVVKKNFTKFCNMVYGQKPAPGRKKKKPQPILITRFGKPFILMTRYDDDYTILEDVKAGKITWEDFKNEIIERGYRDVLEGRVKVRPADVIGAEKVQTEKDRLRLDAAGFMLEAARYFSGHLYLCPNCGHKMLPDIEDEEKPKELSPGSS